MTAKSFSKLALIFIIFNRLFSYYKTNNKPTFLVADPLAQQTLSL